MPRPIKVLSSGVIRCIYHDRHRKKNLVLDKVGGWIRGGWKEVIKNHVQALISKSSLNPWQPVICPI